MTTTRPGPSTEQTHGEAEDQQATGNAASTQLGVVVGAMIGIPIGVVIGAVLAAIAAVIALIISLGSKELEGDRRDYARLADALSRHIAASTDDD